MGARTGTYPEELIDTLALEPGDMVLIRRGNSIIVLDPSEIGGNTSNPIKEDITFSTNSILNNANESDSITLSDRYQILQASTDAPCRLRLYTSNIKRDADINRPIGTDPIGNHGLILELITSIGLLDYDLSPVVDGYSNSSSIPYTITNLSGSTTSIGITLNHLKLGT